MAGTAHHLTTEARRTSAAHNGCLQLTQHPGSCWIGWFSRCYEPQNAPPRNAAAASAVPPTASLATQYFIFPPLRCDNRALLSLLPELGVSRK
jgi:hypothetical protein